jgi:hypothetical protein
MSGCWRRTNVSNWRSAALEAAVGHDRQGLLAVVGRGQDYEGGEREAVLPDKSALVGLAMSALQRIPANLWFLARLLTSGLVLFLGLMALSYIYPDGVITAHDLAKAGRFLVPLGYVVMVFEALVFTIAPTELSIRFFRRSPPGLVAGWLLYVPLLHGPQGWAAVAASGWIASVVNLAYFIERGASARRAAFHAIVLKCFFWTLAWPTLLGAS